MALRVDYPVTLLCELLNYPRSQVYYTPATQPEAAALQRLIQELAGQYPTYGYRRITKELQRMGQPINHKRVARLMSQMGLMGTSPRKRKRTTDSRHDFPRYPNRVLNLTIDRPELVWVADITYIRLQQEFIYLAVLMDVFTRSIRGWHLSRSIDQGLTLTALRKALQNGCPCIHHSDQGVQYAAHEYVSLLQQHQVQISNSPLGIQERRRSDRLGKTVMLSA
jgi:putative transposase